MALFIDEVHVRRLLDWGLALEVVEKAFRKIGLEEATNTPRSRGQTDHVHAYAMIGGAKGMAALGVKIQTTHRKSCPETMLALFDAKLGGLTCLMKAAYLDQIRCGASGAVAIKTLARMDAQTVGILGSGSQARMQLRGAVLVRNLKSIKVFSPTRENRESFAREMAGETGLEVHAVNTAQEAVVGADLILLATTAREPILEAEWISPGAHINAMGATFLGKVEVHPDVFLKTGLVVVDHRESARLEAGDLVEPIESGALHWRDIHDLGPLLVGRYEGRTSEDQITLFKGVGLAVCDVCLGQAVLERALAEGIGHEVPWGQSNGI